MNRAKFSFKIYKIMISEHISPLRNNKI